MQFFCDHTSLWATIYELNDAKEIREIAFAGPDWFNEMEMLIDDNLYDEIFAPQA